MVPLCPSVGLSVPVTRASVAHQVGIGSPYAGQPLPITRATSAQISDLFLGNISFDSLRYLKRLNWIFACFVLSLMILRKRLRVYTIVDFSFIRTFAPSF